MGLAEGPVGTGVPDTQYGAFIGPADAYVALASRRIVVQSPDRYRAEPRGRRVMASGAPASDRPCRSMNVRISK